DAEFIVQMRAGGEPGHADVADRLALADVLADLDRTEMRHVAVQRAVVAAVLDDDDVAVAGLPAAERYSAVAGGVDRRARRRRLVAAPVRTAGAEDRVHPAGRKRRRDAREFHRSPQETLAQRPAVVAVIHRVAGGVGVAERAEALAAVDERRRDDVAVV